MPYVRQSDLEARAGAETVARAIGGRVRHGRNSRGWTLDQLAERSGVSRRMLVSIEQGAANPSIATLLLISDALGIGLPALVELDDQPGLRVNRAGTAPVLWRGKLGGRAVLVAGTEPPDVTELWDWTLGPARVTPARRTQQEPASCSWSWTARSSSGWTSTPKYSPREIRPHSPETCPTDT